MEQRNVPVTQELTEEQSSEPPSTLRAVQEPSSPQAENEPLCKKLSQWNDWR